MAKKGTPSMAKKGRRHPWRKRGRGSFFELVRVLRLFFRPAQRSKRMLQFQFFGNSCLPDFRAERLPTMHAPAQRFEFSLRLGLIDALDPIIR